ncbi:MAG: nitrilase [Fibrobacter sp.]|nr:nitrilase [Fibrobacter sp.]
MSMLDVFLVQMDCGNFDKVRKLLAKANLQKNGLIILPEMFATGYIPKNPADYAEDFSCAAAGNTAHFLSELANETGCTVMGAGIGKGADGKLTNHSSAYQPGQTSEFASYNKVHPFFPELGEFESGADVSLFEINEWNVSSVICYDLRFPELFRSAVKKGAQLITVQAAWPKVRIEHWETLLKARAIENQVYIAAVNAVSAGENSNVDEKNRLGGTSMIITPQGEVISRGSCNCEEVVHNSLDISSLISYRKAFPVLNGIV